MYIEQINGPQDVKKLDKNALTVLAGEIREALIKKLSKRGGHFGPNLGMVEATIALHYVFDSPKDKIVFDVSHQSYAHKMLTGRKDAFLYEEHYGDVSGYSNPKESEHDFFTIGHTSTSVSLACGLAKARDLKGEGGNVIAVIGDGSLSGGEALEGLDYAPELKSNLIIVVNDNDMSIAENHGGLYENLKLLRESDGKAERNIFKAFGLEYVFVKDGNDINSLIEAFKSVKDVNKAVVVHICTEKGKGYTPAEQSKEAWHYCAPFNMENGKSLAEASGADYASMTADYLLGKMKEDKTLVAVTSGTPAVFGFNAEKRKEAGVQFVDVGIAEETAVALSSGVACGGGKAVWGVYSTFVQRTFDQLSQDLCINKNPAVILNFWASIYAMNDVTHLGIYDIPLLSNIPNLVYLAPVTKEEYFSMLDWSLKQREHPVAIRVPVEVINGAKPVERDWSVLNRYGVEQRGQDVAVLALGSFYGLGERACTAIEAITGVKPTLIKPYYISGLDESLLEELKSDHKIVVTLEDGILDGGFGEKVARFYGSSSVKVLNYGFRKEFLDRFNAEDVLNESGITPEAIAGDISELLK
ncbi:1-deoxy-D-xylulose-5-phosphate synthase [Candidatus Proelusimicrobium volucris]|uniref:1-deoxy-D-xylulose-5-phosphate synthase n=1 Tax=Candidatus Proelusimicrobium volucris TaxID=3416225 RepID=UPI003D13DBA9